MDVLDIIGYIVRTPFWQLRRRGEPLGRVPAGEPPAGFLILTFARERRGLARDTVV